MEETKVWIDEFEDGGKRFWRLRNRCGDEWILPADYMELEVDAPNFKRIRTKANFIIEAWECRITLLEPVAFRYRFKR